VSRWLMGTPAATYGCREMRLRIGSVAKAVLVTGQSYQDPKDALNEFVSNAADEYAMPFSPHLPIASGGRLALRMTQLFNGRIPRSTSQETRCSGRSEHLLVESRVWI
jgi:hypothetical protein